MNDSKLPTLLKEVGVAAWHLPAAAMRQTEEHRHAEAQLCGLDAGLAILETGSGAWLCPPGRCVWIPSGMAHSLRSCGKISGWMLHLDGAQLQSLPTEPQVLALTPLLKQVVLRMAEWVEEPTASEQKMRLVAVLRDEIAAAPQVPLHLPMPHTAALKQMAERLATSNADQGNLAELAHQVGVSERSLFRRFQQETGLSPGQWRRQMQVLRAMELLADGCSVTETALEVGYANTGAFIRAFREVTGVTPATYAHTER